MKNLQYPIGEFSPPTNYNDLSSWLKDIEEFPNAISKLTQQLNSVELQKCYRLKGWNIAQVVHHCADSHMNSFMRTKLALTEEHPTIKTYFEDRWALLPDGNSLDLTDSLVFIQAIHKKWVALLNTLSISDLNRTFFHPENQKSVTIGENIAFYSWHCKHHLEHIKIALNA